MDPPFLHGFDPGADNVSAPGIKRGPWIPEEGRVRAGRKVCRTYRGLGESR